MSTHETEYNRRSRLVDDAKGTYLVWELVGSRGSFKIDYYVNGSQMRQTVDVKDESILDDGRAFVEWMGTLSQPA